MASTQTTSSGWRRLLWELLVFGLFAAAAWGIWVFIQDRHRDELQATQEAMTLANLEARRGLEEQLDRASSREARAVARTLAAGIRPLAARSDWPAIDQTVVELLQLDPLEFVHLLATDGTVLVSSDRKMIATGRTGPEARWALQATELTERREPGGLIELAMPLEASEGSLVVLWMGYESAAPTTDSAAATAPTADSTG